MTSARSVRTFLTTGLLWLLVAGGCTDPSDEPPGPGPTPAPTPTVDRSPPVGRQLSASDGGEIEVIEIGFTVPADTDRPRPDAIFAVVLRNTSQTDLLAYARLELTWRAGESTAERVDYLGTGDVPWVYDIRPGETAVIGGEVNIRDLTPESIDVAVYDEWYPMWALDARGHSVGLKVTGYDIDTSDLDPIGRVKVRVDYNSLYEDELLNLGDDDFRLLLVMRDADGSLLGALPAAEFGVWVPGEFRQFGSVLGSDWLAEADPETSGAAITRVCCDRVSA